jgi:hypothetical protein
MSMPARVDGGPHMRSLTSSKIGTELLLQGLGLNATLIDGERKRPRLMLEAGWRVVSNRGISHM